MSLERLEDGKFPPSSLRALMERFHMPVPPRFISTYKTGKGRSVEYISWRDTVLIMDGICAQMGATWSSEIRQFGLSGDGLHETVVVRVLVTAADGTAVYREALGTSRTNAPTASDAPPLEVAERAGLRRAIGLFGISLKPAER